MVEIYRRNAEKLGRSFTDIPEELAWRTAGSTDMANVSLNIPTIHPMLGLGTAKHQGTDAVRIAKRQ